MITVLKWGAMYGMLEEGEKIRTEAVQLGEQLIVPGDKISKIGRKARSTFEMQDGFWLEYVGRVDRTLLFVSRPTGANGDPWYYAFHYVDPETLIIGSEHGCRDIVPDEIQFAVLR